MKMTVAKALNELKLLDSRITRRINESVLAGYVIGKKPMTGFDSIEEIEQRAKSDYQSANDLIKQRNKIKSAIVVSNATTPITVAGVNMTVAEAIEMKSFIEYKKSLLNRLKNTYTQYVNHVERTNTTVKNQLDNHLEVMLGKDGKNKIAENDDFVKSYLSQNEAKLIDPLNLKQKIDELTSEIEAFESDVDYELNRSNVITEITIED